MHAHSSGISACCRIPAPEVLKEAKKLSKASNKKEITWKDVMGWVVEGSISGVTSGITSTIVTDLTPIGIINTIKKVIK